MKAYQIPTKPSTDIFNLPCVISCIKNSESFLYELSEYHDEEDNLVEVLTVEDEFAYVAQAGYWLVFDEDNHVWHVLTEEEYHRIKTKETAFLRSQI